ncbi:MAG TPA: chloride channel protein [Alphaproteobacteria bacterium]|nr:chloride channel protein [Alphaproteobacteria bacterium]
MVTPRRRRRFKAATVLWRRRLVFWLGAVAVGYVAVGFAAAADWAQMGFAKVTAISPYLALILTPAGIALSAFIGKRWFVGSQGSGIPQAIAARFIQDRPRLERLLSLRIAFGKIALTVLGLLVGASIGREGPTVQIGASVLVWLSYRTGMGRQKGLILAGGAAGVAAAFNTPLAGIVFAIEEMSRSFERSISSLVLIAVILAGIAAISVNGTGSYFGLTSAILDGWKDWFVVPVVAVAGGVLGGLFARIALFGARKAPTLFRGFGGRRPVLFAALCGLGVAILGIVSHGASYGTGYGAAKLALAGHLDHPWIFAATKFAATLLSQIAGIPGGILSPSLSIGAGLGAALSHLMPTASPGAVAVLAMVGFFTGAVQAPITGFVIVAEMTGDQAMIIPLMATALVATGISKLITPEPLYHALAEDFRKRLESEH